MHAWPVTSRLVVANWINTC